MGVCMAQISYKEKYEKLNERFKKTDRKLKNILQLKTNRDLSEMLVELRWLRERVKLLEQIIDANRYEVKL
jgi:hypothetical protein